MTPYHSDPWLTVYHGDARAVMAEMEPESVHCVVTSPPYWGLRDYGTATWQGGDPDHEHVGQRSHTAPPGTAKQASNRGANAVRGGDCACGASRVDAQIGLEDTPDAYVESMVAVFREVRRVLRSDGTVWLNLGDSYANTGGMTGGTNGKDGSAKRTGRMFDGGYRPLSPGLKPKDLVGIPWRVAFALQADGWYLRSDIIWSKPNPMPESVTDRPTKAHEYLFLLSKSPRYYFDAEAVREADAGTDHSHRNILTGQPSLEPSGGISGAHGGLRTIEGRNGSGRNLRSVWTIATAPYPGAHFATFPPKLVEPCIKAGTSEKGVCPECGAPWVRKVERTFDTEQRDRILARRNVKHDASRNDAENHNMSGQELARLTSRRDVGWRPSCGHGTMAEAITHTMRTVPATILDPFAGSGTTGMVAQSLSRRAVLIDLSMDYLDQLMDRNRDMPLGLGA